MNYSEFLKSKHIALAPVGKRVDPADIHAMLFPFQMDVVKWSVRKGRCAVFLDTGLGKTFVQIEWARLLGENTLIVAPLSVARQTVREGKKIGRDVRYVRQQSEVSPGHTLWITNYEMVDNFNASAFGSVVLDESSILKSIGGKTRQKITKMFSETKYRLCCTATPAPNDYTEIGNHAHFLGVCTQSEMLSMFFVNANKEHMIFNNGRGYRIKGSNKGGTEWRLKHHAEDAFFSWLSTWAITMTKPSDLGYEDDGFVLPKLNINPIFVEVDYKPSDELFFTRLKGVKHRAEVRDHTVDARIESLKGTIATSKDQWIVWVGLDHEAKAAKAALPDAVEVKGDDTPDEKAHAFEGFQDGDYRILITKPKIGGFGMNFQNAHNMVFFGLSDSWEAYYQCIRRQWRYGQKRPVNVYIIMSNIEADIYRNVRRKDALAWRLRNKLIEKIRDYERGELGMKPVERENYETHIEKGEKWTMMHGDSCERLKEIAENSIDLSVYSPPFADLFTYSPSDRDLGNSRNWPEFFKHYAFIIREMLRVTKPGRLTCVHTSDIPALAQKDGYIGVKDFPGAVIRAYEAEGWIFVGRAFIQKNPQAQAIRTKSKALLFVQIRKDSTHSRPALIDQILLFKKDGENDRPVNPVENGELDNEAWINWAHGIWTGIQETKTLQYSVARAKDDEKHICPLQLETIERCVKLWSNPGETVLSPFGGIGSEGWQAVMLGRKYIGIELKREYYDVAVSNLKAAEKDVNADMLFSTT